MRSSTRRPDDELRQVTLLVDDADVLTDTVTDAYTSRPPPGSPAT